MPTFDGTNLRVILDPGITNYDYDTDIYLPWKDFLLADFLNLGFAPAFDNPVGGNDTDVVAGESVPRYGFLRNDLGWRIRPPEENIEITIVGDLFPKDSTLAMFVTTLGNFATQIRQRLSSRGVVIQTGISGLTNPESVALLLNSELLEADYFFDKTSGLIHYYRRGTVIDLIPPKNVTGETVPGDVQIDQP